MTEPNFLSAAPPTADIVIAGAGVAGAALGVALRRALGPAATVVLADPTLARMAFPSLRAVAVAPDSRALLDELGVWDAVSAEAQPMRSMAITDSRPGALPNPTFLTFPDRPDAAEGEPLAHMVPLDRMRGALIEACRQAGVVLTATRIVDFVATPHALTLTTADGEHSRARLLVAADGGRSRLRHAARIQTVGRRYPQAAVTATLTHATPHAGRATQHFLPSGPLALLPLRAEDGTERRTSLVWTEQFAEASRLAALAPEAFVAAFESRAGLGLGVTTLEDRPQAFPLEVMLARSLVAPRFALIGDAARTIHPLAGQGLNLALRDVAALTRGIVEQVGLGLDPGARSVLRVYETERRFDASLMAGVTDGLDRLFSNDRLSLRTMRDLGLGLVDRAPGLKQFFMRQAMGLTSSDV